jgi:NAD+-dependent protein deacetylase SIR2
MSGLFNHLRADSTRPTQFHKLLQELANEHRLLHHYTQNIDCLELSLPRLEASTVRLHGRVDQLRCTRCDHTSQFEPPPFPGAGLRPCPNCERNVEHISKGLCKRIIGLLRPNVLLDDEPDPDEDTVRESLLDDIEEYPDLVLVAGMSTASENILSLVQATRSLGGKTFWVNKEEPSSKLKPLFDYVYQGDCDAIAHLYNLEPRSHRLTYDQLRDYDDRLTDVLVDHVRF